MTREEVKTIDVFFRSKKVPMLSTYYGKWALPIIKDNFKDILIFETPEECYATMEIMRNNHYVAMPYPIVRDEEENEVCNEYWQKNVKVKWL